jgi:hypothetical protein
LDVPLFIFSISDREASEGKRETYKLLTAEGAIEERVNCGKNEVGIP